MRIEKTDSSIDKMPLLYSKDFYEWPQYWMGFEKDLDVGNKILQEFIPFIGFLAQRNVARSTMRKYMSDLSVLGSEIIRRIHDNEKQRKWPAKKIILDYIDDSGGPLPNCWNPNELTEQRYITAYDSVCRRLHRFLSSLN